MTEQELIQKLRNFILEKYRCTCAKDYEIMGRAVEGCSLITINQDGSITNGFSIITRRNTNATWRASELIDWALEEVTKENNDGK